MSAPRVTNTVWWFLKNLGPDDTLLSPSMDLAYPPTTSRPYLQDNGSDLIERAFFEPDLRVCLVTGQGPVSQKQMPTELKLGERPTPVTPPIAPGTHHTLTYTQIDTGEEYFSSLSEILHWIDTGPLLQPPKSQAPVNSTEAPVTTPVYVPASLQYIPRTPSHDHTTPALLPDSQSIPDPRPVKKRSRANRIRQTPNSVPIQEPAKSK
jgi:hypothetical protein